MAKKKPAGDTEADADKPKFNCAVCGFQTVNRQPFKNHMRMKHQILDGDGSDSRRALESRHGTIHGRFRLQHFRAVRFAEDHRSIAALPRQLIPIR